MSDQNNNNMNPKVNNESSEYGASSIKVLKGLEAVQKRPGMYIGNTDDGSGLHHMIYEVTDNAVDESLAGHCDTVKITLHSDGSASVLDNGRGIPTDMHAGEGISAAQVIMTQLHAGGKFDQNSYQMSAGLHGVGVSVVNALSVWLELVIWRNNKIFFMRFKHGQAEEELKEISSLDEYVSKGSKDEELFSMKPGSHTHGTYVRFIPDSNIFTNVEFSFNTLSTRYRELSYLNPGLKFDLKDEKENKHKIFHDSGGVKSFVLENAKNKTLLFDEPFETHSFKDDIYVDIALVWSANAYDDNTICFTNNIPQKEGGTHLQGFRAGITRSIQKVLPENKLKGLTPTGEDIREGLFCVLSVKVPDPKFDSQTKNKLVSSKVRTVVESVITETLDRWLEENPHHTRVITERIIEAVRAREAARKARDLSRKTKTFEGGLSVASKLADCSERNPAKRELFIVEGQSAGGSAKQARDRKNQAVLALQGKILNVEKAILSKILQYDAIRTLVAVLGTGIEDGCLPEECKYHKIIIMTDADVDGSHIRTLLLTFLFRYMYPLIEAGYVYVSRPPLYAIKSKKHNTIYIKDDKELEDYIIKATRKNLEIYIDNQQVNDDKKDELYHLAFQAHQELSAFSPLVKEFMESGVLLKNFDESSREEFEKFLGEKYRDVSIFSNVNVRDIKEEKIYLDDDNQDNDAEETNVEDTVKNTIIENIWTIKYTEYAQTKVQDIILRPLSDEVKKWIKDWPEFAVKVHTKMKKVDSILGLYELIKELQANTADISRFKGLGEMNPKELKDTGMDVYSRSIEQVKASDAEDADFVTKLLMGSEVLPRRQFIEENALNANVDA